MNSHNALIERIRHRLEVGDVELPVFDRVAIDIHREARENRLDAQGICKLLEQDVTLVSEVLRMANSSFFSGLTEVRTLRNACVRLGVRQIASIVFSVSQKRLYSASAGPFRPRLAALWQHASSVSIGARWLALRAGHPVLGDEAFVAGLLHDVGKLSLLRIVEQLSRDDGEVPDAPSIDAVLSRLNREHGAQILQLWNVPALYRDVQQQLDDEALVADQPLLAIVRLADLVCQQAGIGGAPASGTVGAAEMAALGLTEEDMTELIDALSGEHDPAREAA